LIFKQKSSTSFVIDPTSVTFDLFGDSAMPLAFCWIFSKLRAYCFVNDPGPSPGCSSRGGHIFKIQYWMYAATGWAKREMGGLAPLASPPATPLQ